jgi:hypothetical protein
MSNIKRHENTIVRVEETSTASVFFNDPHDGTLIISAYSSKEYVMTPPNLSLYLNKEACKDLLEILKRIEKRSKKNGL